MQSQSVPRASQVSSQIDETFSLEHQNTTYSVIFSSLLFKRKREEERDALYKHDYNAGRLSLHATRFG